MRNMRTVQGDRVQLTDSLDRTQEAKSRSIPLAGRRAHVAGKARMARTRNLADPYEPAPHERRHAEPEAADAIR